MYVELALAHPCNAMLSIFIYIIILYYYMQYTTSYIMLLVTVESNLSSSFSIEKRALNVKVFCIALFKLGLIVYILYIHALIYIIIESSYL